MTRTPSDLPSSGEELIVRSHARGFTLIEMLVIMVLISISVALVYPSLHGIREKFDSTIEKTAGAKEHKKETFTSFVTDGISYKAISTATRP